MPSVFITGSGKRLGRYFALQFAKHDWDVAVHYHSSSEGARQISEEIRALGRNVCLVKADLRSRSELKKAFAEAHRTLGKIAVLVNNAGVMPPRMKLADIGEDVWDDTFHVNVRSGLFCAQIFSEYLKELSQAEDFRHRGRIINLASLGGREIWRERIPYNVSKAAAIQLTKALARELAPEISVNCVCPGAILVSGEPNENEKQMVKAERIPMQRYGSPRDVFDAVHFFATASQYITAQVLTVDGGYHDAR